MAQTTGKVTSKAYRCSECGGVQQMSTNHYGECYPFCVQCQKPTRWLCMQVLPEGWEKPAPWKIGILGYPVEVKGD